MEDEPISHSALPFLYQNFAHFSNSTSIVGLRIRPPLQSHSYQAPDTFLSGRSSLSSQGLLQDIVRIGLPLERKQSIPQRRDLSRTLVAVHVVVSPKVNSMPFDVKIYLGVEIRRELMLREAPDQTVIHIQLNSNQLLFLLQKSVKVLDLEQACFQSHSLKLNEPVKQLYHKDSKILCMGLRDIFVYDMRVRGPTLCIRRQKGQLLTKLCVNPQLDSLYLLGCLDGSISAQDLRYPAKIIYDDKLHTQEVRQLKFCKAYPSNYLSADSSTVLIWDIDQHNKSDPSPQLKRLKFYHSQKKLLGVEWIGTWISSISEDSLQLWQLIQ